MSGRYGPQTAETLTLIDLIRHLTPDEIDRLAAAWAARDAARVAARDAASAAARDAARDAAWDAALAAAWAARDAARAAARDAALAVSVRDLIPDETYQLLAAPWESVMGVQS